MMDEGQVRQLLAVLKGNLEEAPNVIQVAAFSGGISALEMVLDE